MNEPDDIAPGFTFTAKDAYRLSRSELIYFIKDKMLETASRGFTSFSTFVEDRFLEELVISLRNRGFCVVDKKLPNNLTEVRISWSSPDEGPEGVPEEGL